jgi:predicted nucleotidyltransferase
MTSELCVPRERATGYLLELLERICAGGKYLDCITAIHAFGSWSRGAIEVGDVDLNISYDHRLDDEVNRELVRHLATGRDWNTPFRKALKARRALHIMFNQLEMIGEPVLLYERGDSFAAPVTRKSQLVLASPVRRAAARKPPADKADTDASPPILREMHTLARRRECRFRYVGARRWFSANAAVDRFCARA